jgi:hypothetical protein
MDFVIIGEEDLLEDNNVCVNNSAVVFNNKRVRVIIFYCVTQLYHRLSILR